MADPIDSSARICILPLKGMEDFFGRMIRSRSTLFSLLARTLATAACEINPSAS
jgi:hypothetical protein